MPKDAYVKKQNGVNLRLKEIQAPLQKIACEMDRSLNWLVCKMLKDHPLLKDFLEKEGHAK